MALIIHSCLLALIAGFCTSCDSCVPKPIRGDDALFCSEDLHVIYPEIGDVGGLYIPACNGYIQMLVHSWDMPQIKYDKAKPGVSYVVIMADPDAPSRSKPIRKSWRHLLVADIPGEELLTGNILSGRILSEYTAPSPPKNTGYHRYQIMVFMHQGKTLDLLPEEKQSLGNWDPYGYAEQYHLVGPVATTQFMAQNPANEEQEV